jgi:hypothetical protein
MSRPAKEVLTEIEVKVHELRGLTSYCTIDLKKIGELIQQLVATFNSERANLDIELGQSTNDDIREVYEEVKYVIDLLDGKHEATLNRLADNIEAILPKMLDLLLKNLQ